MAGKGRKFVLFSLLSLSILTALSAFSALASNVPQRIVSAMPSITEMLFALDLDKEIVGVTTNCNYPPAAKTKPKIGGFQLNLESVTSLKPDLVIMLEETQGKEIDKLKKFGLPVYVLSVKSIEDVLTSLVKLGEVTGKEEAARQIVRQIEERLKKVNERAKKPKPSLVDVLALWQSKTAKRAALVVVGLNPMIVAGQGTFIDDLLLKAGVANAARDARAAYPQYSFEKLVSENPAYLIMPANLVSRRELKTSRRWQSLSAVKENRVLFIDQDILARPGPRVIDAIEQIADFIYR